MSLRGKWIVEFAEMSSISKAEAGALKAFPTQTEERYVPKYGRVEVIEVRQCVFIGTTNKTAHLRDETGGRRFWPIKIGIIDIDVLIRDRDQLFAEAMHAFAAETPWWPGEAFEHKNTIPQQEPRYDTDVWEEEIRIFTADKDKVTILQIARDGLLIHLPKVGTSDQRRITAVLEQAGWEGDARGNNGERFWKRITHR